MCALSLLLACLFVCVRPAAAAQEGTFSAELTQEDSILTLQGDAGFMPLPSMFSLYLQAEEGRCAIHLSGFTKPPSAGTFQVESSDSLKIRALCILENREPRERLLAETGLLTITGRTAVTLDGTFDMMLIGGVTGKTLRLKGSFASRLKTTI